MCWLSFMFFFSSRRRHTRCSRDWSSDVCSSDLEGAGEEPGEEERERRRRRRCGAGPAPEDVLPARDRGGVDDLGHAVLGDRKSTRLNSSHGYISYAVFCLKKKKKSTQR